MTIDSIIQVLFLSNMLKCLVNNWEEVSSLIFWIWSMNENIKRYRPRWSTFLHRSTLLFGVLFWTVSYFIKEYEVILYTLGVLILFFHYGHAILIIFYTKWLHKRSGQAYPIETLLQGMIQMPPFVNVAKQTKPFCCYIEEHYPEERDCIPGHLFRLYLARFKIKELEEIAGAICDQFVMLRANIAELLAYYYGEIKKMSFMEKKWLKNLDNWAPQEEEMYLEAEPWIEEEWVASEIDEDEEKFIEKVRKRLGIKEIWTYQKESYSQPDLYHYYYFVPLDDTSAHGTELDDELYDEFLIIAIVEHRFIWKKKNILHIILLVPGDPVDEMFRAKFQEKRRRSHLQIV